MNAATPAATLQPVSLADLELPANSKVLVLAPHPDDFDAIGVSLRFLHEHGRELHLAVLTSGANGIDDGWEGLNDKASKTAAREAEQLASCRFFGLPAERVHFLRLWEQDRDEEDDARLNALIREIAPGTVFLPHGNDSNRTHRRTYETFARIARAERLQVSALLNLDAKTLGMRRDVYMCFDENEAQWKAELLRHHRSQQERNLASRGHGFDERVLAVNRQAAEDAQASLPYAEVFEVEIFG